MSYSQNDPAWKNILLGFNTSAQWTIGTAGCYVAAIANVCRWAGNDLNPQQINDICKQNGWFVNGGEIARDDIPALLCSNLGYIGRTNWSGPTDINFFDDASSPDVAYIIEIDASRAPGIQSHFTMVWSKPDANDLEIDDSWDGVRKALSHYGSPSAIILSAMKFVKVAPPSPPPVAVVPVIVVPPAAPPPIPYVPPTGALAIPKQEKYTLTVALPYYSSLQAVQNLQAAAGRLPVGDYYVIEKAGTNSIYYNLTSDNSKNLNHWVNVLNNKAQPVIPAITPHIDNTADIMKSWQWGYPSHEPVEYKVLHDLLVVDMIHNSASIWIRAGHNIDIYGSFMQNGKTYLRPLTSLDDKGLYAWYGIETSNIHTGAPHLENEYNITDIVNTHWQSLYDKVYQTIDGFFRPRSKIK